MLLKLLYFEYLYGNSIKAVIEFKSVLQIYINGNIYTIDTISTTLETENVLSEKNAVSNEELLSLVVGIHFYKRDNDNHC